MQVELVDAGGLVLFVGAAEEGQVSWPPLGVDRLAGAPEEEDVEDQVEALLCQLPLLDQEGVIRAQLLRNCCQGSVEPQAGQSTGVLQQSTGLFQCVEPFPLGSTAIVGHHCFWILEVPGMLTVSIESGAAEDKDCLRQGPEAFAAHDPTSSEKSAATSLPEGLD
eukprot:2523663-Lingulodinium_polyedra.AAC.1